MVNLNYEFRNSLFLSLLLYIFALLMFLPLLCSCSKEPPIKEMCLYTCSPIFTDLPDTILYKHSFVSDTFNNFSQEIAQFKDFELRVFQAGCDSIYQEFSFYPTPKGLERARSIVYFKYLGSLAPRYLIYNQLSLAIRDTFFSTQDTVELQPGFFVTIPPTKNKTLKFKMWNNGR